MRFSILLLMSGILLLSACGADEDNGFSFNRDVPPEAKTNGTISSVLELSPNLRTRYELVAGQGRACMYGALQNSNVLSCWGRSIHPNDREQVGGFVKGNDNMLSIGEDHVCTTLVDSARRVHCDGSNEFGENTDPDAIKRNNEIIEKHWLKNPSLVASGNRHNCALDEYGVYCWGSNSKGQTNVPSLTNPKWVAAGGDTSCAIDDDGKPECWGDNSAGQTDIPDNVTFVTGLAVGSDFVCASNVGSIECWGNTEDWDVQPTSVTEVVHLSAGGDHVCILDRTQDSPEIIVAECFGNDDSTASLLSVPEGIQSNIRSISAGYGFTCASNNYSGYEWYDDNKDSIYELEPQLGVLCWGNNEENQASAPRQLCLGYHDEAIPLEARTCP